MSSTPAPSPTAGNHAGLAADDGRAPLPRGRSRAGVRASLATGALAALLLASLSPAAPMASAAVAAVPAAASSDASATASATADANTTATQPGSALLGQESPGRIDRRSGSASGTTLSAAASVKRIKVGKKERLTVLVNLKSWSKLAGADKVAKAHGAKRTASWSALSVAVYALPNGASVTKAEAFTAALRKNSGVTSAGISGRIEAQPKPVSRINTSRIKPKAAVGDIARLADSVRANKIATGKGVTVGVADEGVFDENPAVRGAVRTSLGASCVTGGALASGSTQGRPVAAGAGHGTAVSNVIAGSTKVGANRGIAPGAKIASVRVVTVDGHIFPESSICAQMWAVKHKLPILNMSYGVDWAGALPGGNLWDLQWRDHAAVYTAMKRSQDYAYKRGVLTVAAAGNDGADIARKYELEDAFTGESFSSKMRLLPAELPKVLTVSMTEASRKIDPYSNVGLKVVDIAAQGTGVLATNRTRFEEMGGTSFASPAVAATAALVKQKHPKFSPGSLSWRLQSTATKRTCSKAGWIYTEQRCRTASGRTNFFGAGTVNAYQAVRK